MSPISHQRFLRNKNKPKDWKCRCLWVGDTIYNANKKLAGSAILVLLKKKRNDNGLLLKAGGPFCDQSIIVGRAKEKRRADPIRREMNKKPLL